MILSRKVRILPREEQRILINKSFGCKRYIYNWGIDQMEAYYKANSHRLSNNDLRKSMTQLKHSLIWLKEVGSNVLKHSLIDLDKAYDKFLKKQAGRPKYKKKRISESFYVNYESCKVGTYEVRCEKLGWIKTSEQLPFTKISNPHISFDGKYYYFSAGFKTEKVKQELTNTILGIDLGIKNTAVLSNGKIYKNINKTRTCKNINKKIKRVDRQITRSMKNSKNQAKLKLQRVLLYRRLSNIRKNFRHQMTTEIVKMKPKRIVVEGLKVSNMLRNKYLAKYISPQGFYDIRKMLEYKCEKFGIEFVVTNTFYPSSKLCSNCGHKKDKLHLFERTYLCSNCGFKCDRDLNASYNLANYTIKK